MEGIAFDMSADGMASADYSDPLYQIAMQMKLENVVDASSYLISVSESPMEEKEYRTPLENIINSYSKEDKKTSHL